MSENAVGPRVDMKTRFGSDVRATASRLAPLGVLAVLVLAVAAVQPTFLSVRSVTTVLDESSSLMVLAVGETLVILIGGIDLSVAALASMATVLLARLLPELGWAAPPLVVGFTTLAGAAQGFVHVRAQIPSFVVTLGGMGLWSGIALTVSNASSMSVSKGYDAIGWGFGNLGGVPRSFLVALVILVLLASVVRWLPLGRWMHATGNAEPAALLSGVPVGRVKISAFALSGLCAGITGVLLVARSFSAAPGLADSLLLPALSAVVVGGTAITGGYGGLGRTFIGVLIIMVLRVGLAIAGVDPSFEQITYGSVLILAVALTIDRSKIPVMK
jgi:ribose transport system permease protein